MTLLQILNLLNMFQEQTWTDIFFTVSIQTKSHQHLCFVIAYTQSLAVGKHILSACAFDPDETLLSSKTFQFYFDWGNEFHSKIIPVKSSYFQQKVFKWIMPQMKENCYLSWPLFELAKNWFMSWIGRRKYLWCPNRHFRKFTATCRNTEKQC